MSRKVRPSRWVRAGRWAMAAFAVVVLVLLARYARTVDWREVAAELFAAELGKLRQLVETDLPALERGAEQFGAPWTPGRVPAAR